MKNRKFKEALIDFFVIHWASDEIAAFLGNTLIHLNFRNCFSYQTINGKRFEYKIIDDLYCDLHKEADIKIIYHACSIAEQYNIEI